MAERELGVAVGGDTLLLSQRILVLLASALDQGDQSDEAEQEEKLILVTVHGVHAIQGEWLTEALIAHVKGADE